MRMPPSLGGANASSAEGLVAHGEAAVGSFLDAAPRVRARWERGEDPDSDPTRAGALDALEQFHQVQTLVGDGGEVVARVASGASFAACVNSRAQAGCWSWAMATAFQFQRKSCATPLAPRDKALLKRALADRASPRAVEPNLART